MNHFVHCCSFSTSNKITSKGCQSASQTCDFDVGSKRKALRHGSHSVTCNYTNACLYLVIAHQIAHPQTEVAHI